MKQKSGLIKHPVGIEARWFRIIIWPEQHQPWHSAKDTRTQIPSPGCLCNPRTFCLRCLSVFHDQTILYPFISFHTIFPSVFPSSFLSIFCLLLSFFFTLPLTSDTYSSLICPFLPPANCFSPSLPSDHSSPHYFSGGSTLLPLAPSASFFFFLPVFSCQPHPVVSFTLLLPPLVLNHFQRSVI